MTDLKRSYDMEDAVALEQQDWDTLKTGVTNVTFGLAAIAFGLVAAGLALWGLGTITSGTSDISAWTGDSRFFYALFTLVLGVVAGGFSAAFAHDLMNSSVKIRMHDEARRECDRLRRELRDVQNMCDRETFHRKALAYALGKARREGWRSTEEWLRASLSGKTVIALADEQYDKGSGT